MHAEVLTPTVLNQMGSFTKKRPNTIPKTQLDCLATLFSNSEDAFLHSHVALLIVCDQIEADLIRDTIKLNISYLSNSAGAIALIVSGTLLAWKYVFESRNSNPQFVKAAYGKFSSLPYFLREVKLCPQTSLDC
mgnify:CR=1 FL=1